MLNTAPHSPGISFITASPRRVLVVAPQPRESARQPPHSSTSTHPLLLPPLVSPTHGGVVLICGKTEPLVRAAGFGCFPSTLVGLICVDREVCRGLVPVDTPSNGRNPHQPQLVWYRLARTQLCPEQMCLIMQSWHKPGKSREAFTFWT